MLAKIYFALIVAALFQISSARGGGSQSYSGTGTCTTVAWSPPANASGNSYPYCSVMTFTITQNCFSGMSTVLVGINKSTFAKGYYLRSIPMRHLRVGDFIAIRWVLSRSSGNHPDDRLYEMSEVVDIRHQDQDASAVFLNISASGENLLITHDHLIYRFQNNVSEAVFAKELEVGHEIMVHGQIVPIENIEPVQAHGVYAPETKSGYLLVDGFAVSSYAYFRYPEIARKYYQIRRALIGVNVPPTEAEQFLSRYIGQKL
jgi:hypothetical protein